MWYLKCRRYGFAKLRLIQFAATGNNLENGPKPKPKRIHDAVEVHWVEPLAPLEPPDNNAQYQAAEPAELTRYRVVTQ